MRACHSSSLTRERSGFTRASWSGAVLVVIGNAPRPGGSGPDISTRTECGCRQARARPKIIAGGPPCAEAISASAWPGLPPCPGLAGPIRAAAGEAGEVRIARQYGLPYLSMMVMERQALIEKHATQQGLPGLRAQWTTLGGTSALTDGLLSGQLDFIVPGVPALVTLWDKTVGTAQEVRALSAVQSMPFVLVTRNPAVRSIADFGAGDRIALPALLAGNSPITSHYTVSPFHYYELANPALHAVLKSCDTLGGKHTNGVLVGTKKFRDANPKLYAAVLAAQEEANGFIAAHPREAAAIYVAMTGDTRSPPD